MSDWKIVGQAAGCSVCEKAFEAGEAFASAIFSGDGEAYERRDACVGCFARIENAPFSRWITRRPDADKKAPPLDLTLAKDFLVRLAGENDPARHGLMYILSLLLLRKRKVKLLEQRGTDEGGAEMEFSVATEEGEVNTVIPVCELSAEDRGEIEGELGRLFGLE